MNVTNIVLYFIGHINHDQKSNRYTNCEHCYKCIYAAHWQFSKSDGANNSAPVYFVCCALNTERRPLSRCVFIIVCCTLSVEMLCIRLMYRQTIPHLVLCAKVILMKRMKSPKIARKTFYIRLARCRNPIKFNLLKLYTRAPMVNVK